VNELRSIALVGLMGSGKSAVARGLGERLRVPVADLDARIAAGAGCSIAEMFARDGEAEFRERETEALRHALEDGSGVIACGGGVVLAETNRTLLERRCRTVWLDVDVEAAARRIGPDRATRPLAQGETLVARLDQLLTERWKLYAAVAIARIDTTGRGIEEVAGLVLDTLEMGALPCA